MKISVLSSFVGLLFVLMSCNKTDDCKGLKNTQWVLVQLDTIPIKSPSKERDWFIKFKDDEFTFGEKDLTFNGKFSTKSDSLFVEYKFSDGISQGQ